MKNLTFLFLLISTLSCQFIENQEHDEKQLLEKQLKEIDWKTVDQLPTLAMCDSLPDLMQRKECFFLFFSSEIKAKLRDVVFSKYYQKDKILNIKVTIVPESELHFESEIAEDSLVVNKQKIDSILKEKLIDFPVVNPAIKHGVYVKSEFIVPFKIVK